MVKRYYIHDYPEYFGSILTLAFEYFGSIRKCLALFDR